MTRAGDSRRGMPGRRAGPGAGRERPRPLSGQATWGSVLVGYGLAILDPFGDWPGPFGRFVKDTEVRTQERMPYLDVIADLGTVELLEARVPDQHLEGIELGDEPQGCCK